MIYTKHYTVKEWKRFDRVAERENGIDITYQEILLQKYDVILTDYKIKPSLKDMLSPKNINRNIDRFQNGVTKFTKALEKLDGSKMKLFPGVSIKEYESLLGKEKKVNYSGLMGNKRNFTALTSKKKVKLF